MSDDLKRLKDQLEQAREFQAALGRGVVSFTLEYRGPPDPSGARADRFTLTLPIPVPIVRPMLNQLVEDLKAKYAAALRREADAVEELTRYPPKDTE